MFYSVLPYYWFVFSCNGRYFIMITTICTKLFSVTDVKQQIEDDLQSSVAQPHLTGKCSPFLRQWKLRHMQRAALHAGLF